MFVDQLLRSLWARRLLAKPVAECLEEGRFPLTHRVFQRGVDCACAVAGQPAPPLEVWTRTHKGLPKEGQHTVVCRACREVDVAGAHVPEDM